MVAVEKVNVAEKFRAFREFWSPKVVGELNDSFVKLVKLKGEFVWHHHDAEDELFFVTRGTMRLQLRDRELRVHKGEFVIVPKGVEHRPVADDEAHVLLFEPKSTRNTGNLANERTVEKPERI